MPMMGLTGQIQRPGKMLLVIDGCARLYHMSERFDIVFVTQIKVHVGAASCWQQGGLPQQL
jgi:hypothetical protein